MVWGDLQVRDSGFIFCFGSHVTPEFLGVRLGVNGNVLFIYLLCLQYSLYVPGSWFEIVSIVYFLVSYTLVRDCLSRGNLYFIGINFSSASRTQFNRKVCHAWLADVSGLSSARARCQSISNCLIIDIKSAFS